MTQHKRRKRMEQSAVNVLLDILQNALKLTDLQRLPNNVITDYIISKIKHKYCLNTMLSFCRYTFDWSIARRRLNNRHLSIFHSKYNQI